MQRYCYVRKITFHKLIQFRRSMLHHSNGVAETSLFETQRNLHPFLHLLPPDCLVDPWSKVVSAVLVTRFPQCLHKHTWCIAGYILLWIHRLYKEMQSKQLTIKVIKHERFNLTKPRFFIRSFDQIGFVIHSWLFPLIFVISR